MQGKKIKEISYRKNKTQKRHFSSESVHFQPTIFNSIFFVITKLIFQILKALTNTCFNMHILFSNQSYSISSPTVLYCYNHMYRTFTDPKLFCCLPHRCIIIYNISCNLNGSFFDIIFQNIPL